MGSIFKGHTHTRTCTHTFITICHQSSGSKSNSASSKRIIINPDGFDAPPTHYFCRPPPRPPFWGFLGAPPTPPPVVTEDGCFPCCPPRWRIEPGFSLELARGFGVSEFRFDITVFREAVPLAASFSSSYTLFSAGASPFLCSSPPFCGSIPSSSSSPSSSDSCIVSLECAQAGGISTAFTSSVRRWS